jgi:hypothetical protein
MTRVYILATLLLVAFGSWLLPRIWNSTENGPTLRDPSAFIGCYQSGANRVVLSHQSVTIPRTHQSTRVVRFFYLKNDAAIHTVGNLEYDVGGHNLRVGMASSGFFYTFDNPTEPSALLIPDNGGTIRRLSRVAC